MFFFSPLRILRPWQNSEPRSITNTTLCTKCGGAGHIASDCKFTRYKAKPVLDCFLKSLYVCNVALSVLNIGNIEN